MPPNSNQIIGKKDQTSEIFTNMLGICPLPGSQSEKEKEKPNQTKGSPLVGELGE